MKVEIKISAEIKEPFVIIHTNTINEEIQRIVSCCESKENIITAKNDEKINVLEPSEIFMIRTENKDVIIYDEKNHYLSNKKLYELEEILGNNFMRISKSTIVNLKQIDSVEPSFNAMMYLIMKNGCKDYITRSYLKKFKSYLGI